MPNYELPSAPVARPGIATGKLYTVEEPWAHPRVQVYLPPGYDRDRSYPVLYTADGSAWVELIRLPTILDNLIANGVIEPAIAVLIDSEEDRRSWYYFNPRYLAYLERVIDYIDDRYATKASANARIHFGASAGGRASLYAALERPELFANIAMLSPSLFGPPHVYEPYFSGTFTPARNLIVFLSVGTYEGSLYADTKLMERYFSKVGLSIRARYTNEGHSFGTWRAAAVDAITYFLSAAGSSEGQP